MGKLYVIVGASAGALIGVQVVVITLIARRPDGPNTWPMRATTAAEMSEVRRVLVPPLRPQLSSPSEPYRTNSACNAACNV